MGSKSAPMSDASVNARIEAGRKAVMAQTELLHREFGRARSLWKEDGTRVTPVDLAISEWIMKEILATFTEDQFFSEELAQPEGGIPVSSEFCWILDPVDGTNNYALGLVHCAISLGLFRAGRPIYGIVYDLSRRCLIEGGPGYGVSDGGRRAQIRDEVPTPQALVGFHSPYERRFSSQALALVENTKIRGLGSSTLHLAYVAAGIIDGTVDHNVRLWDIAAAIPLVWAAGGETRFLNGELFPLKTFDLKMPRIFYVAGSTRMCDHLVRVIGV